MKYLKIFAAVYAMLITPLFIFIYALGIKSDFVLVMPILYWVASVLAAKAFGDA